VWIVAANVFSSSLIIFSLMMKAVRFSETSVLIRVTWRYIKKTAFFIVTAAETSNLTLSYTGRCVIMSVIIYKTSDALYSTIKCVIKWANEFATYVSVRYVSAGIAAPTFAEKGE
jgi:hypothetical protein